jgi:hypothetical protein
MAGIEKRCYDLGLMVVGVEGAMMPVSPCDDLEMRRQR